MRQRNQSTYICVFGAKFNYSRYRDGIYAGVCACVSRCSWQMHRLLGQCCLHWNKFVMDDYLKLSVISEEDKNESERPLKRIRVQCFIV